MINGVKKSRTLVDTILKGDWMEHVTRGEGISRAVIDSIVIMRGEENKQVENGC